MMEPCFAAKKKQKEEKKKLEFPLLTNISKGSVFIACADAMSVDLLPKLFARKGSQRLGIL